MYKVRDTYQSNADTSNLRPHVFNRDASEGNSKYTNNYIFDDDKELIYSKSTKGDEPEKLDTLAYTECIFDAVTLIYYTRTLDFSNAKINDEIPLKIILDEEIFDSYIKYMGKEEIELKNGKVFNAIKFTTFLIEGSIFAEGEEMTVWVSDDKNHLPVKIEAEILIGSINAELLNYSGLSYPLSSEIFE